MTGRRGLLAILLLAVAVPAGQAEDPPETTDWPKVIAQWREIVYQRPQDRAARQQLATAYNNYGVGLGQQGQWDQAVAQLQEALRLEPSNAQFQRNLSNLYVNQAHAAYQRHELAEARAALHAAIALTPDLAQAYILLGEVEYHSQRLKEAKAAWQRALQLDPTQAPMVQGRLDQVTQELPVEGNFERLWQAYFDLRYEEQLQRPVGFDIRDALLEARREVGGDFAYWPKHKVIVLIYSAGSFRRLRQETPDWVAGQFDGKIRVPLPDREMAAGTVKQILFHEYTHALIHDLTNGRCPVWLNEGLAEYEGRTQQPGPLAHLAQAQAAERLIPWERLSEQFSHALSADEVALGYQQSYSIVAYLVHRYGFWRIRRILKAVGEGKAWEAVLAEELRLKLPRLEQHWREWLPELLGRDGA